MMHWSGDFIGIPFRLRGRDRSGCDCWGLVRLAFAARGIELPSYADGYVDLGERDEIAALIAGEARQSWRRLVAPDEAREWDVAVFRDGPLALHIGIVVEMGRMLHVVRDRESIIESYRDGRWLHRLTGIYRHASI